MLLEVTQDIASKGLGQGYEICTPQQKDMLVSELVDTLLTGKRSGTNHGACRPHNCGRVAYVAVCLVRPAAVQW